MRQNIEYPPVRSVAVAGLAALRVEHAAVCPGGPALAAKPDGAAEIPE